VIQDSIRVLFKADKLLNHASREDGQPAPATPLFVSYYLALIKGEARVETFAL